MMSPDFHELRVYLTTHGADSEAAPLVLREVALEAYLAHREKTFTELLFALIRERCEGNEVEVYKRAHVDRKLFSKIRSDRFYQPKKPTVIQFALALRLNVEETRQLLRAAGYSLSQSAPFDLIITYYLERQTYDMNTINAALYHFKQPVLGVG
jgi:hypothetical protein